MAILKAKTTVTQKNITVRIPADLHAEIETLRDTADAAGFSFSIGEIVAEALAKAARQARAELEAFAKQTAQEKVVQIAQDSSAEATGSFA